MVVFKAFRNCTQFHPHPYEAKIWAFKPRLWQLEVPDVAALKVPQVRMQWIPFKNILEVHGRQQRFRAIFHTVVEQEALRTPMRLKSGLSNRNHGN